jgi:quercetin dioxygenase-like cupin family protein
MFTALLVGLAPPGATAAQPEPMPVPLVAPPGPTSRFPTRFTIADAPETFDQVLTVIEFPPGSWTLPRTSGGNVYNTVIEGLITTRPWGSTDVTTYEAGGSFVETAGEYTEIGNVGAGGARMISTTVLPKGARLSAYAEVNLEGFSTYLDGLRIVPGPDAPPRPTTIRHSWVEIERPVTAFELVHLLVEFEPGVWTPRHVHGGQELAMVATGVITLERRGEAETFSPGQSWVNEPGLLHMAGNESEAMAQVAATFLLPTGAVLTTVQPAEAPSAIERPGQPR